MVEPLADESRRYCNAESTRSPNAAVEAERTFKVRDLEMYMADRDFRVDLSITQKAFHDRKRVAYA
jgi:hypothetical protein